MFSGIRRRQAGSLIGARFAPVQTERMSAPVWQVTGLLERSGFPPHVLLERAGMRKTVSLAALSDPTLWLEADPA